MRRIIVGLAVVALWGIAVGIAGAQRPDGGGPPPVGQPACRPEPFGELLGVFAMRLGAHLGASEEEVQAALPQTVAEMRPQIEMRLRQVCQPGLARPGGPPFPGGSPQGAGSPLPPQVVLRVSAQVLGLDPAALQQELEQGRSLAAIARDQGVEPDVLAEQLTQAMERVRLEQMRQGIRRFLEQPLAPQGERPDRPTP